MITIATKLDPEELAKQINDMGEEGGEFVSQLLCYMEPDAWPPIEEWFRVNGSECTTVRCPRCRRQNWAGLRQCRHCRADIPQAEKESDND